MDMDIWKYYDITHRRHVVCNPTSVAKLDELIDVIDLKPGAKAVDIACGKGEMLVRLAERYGISGIGVDISPFFVADCRRRAEERLPGTDIEFVLCDGAEYRLEPPGSADLAMCLGASWVFGGHMGTLRALAAMTGAGGLVLVGEPFWPGEPDEGYLAAGDLEKEAYSTHHGNVTIGEEEGLVPLYTVVSSQDDWDRYETLQWRAADEYASEHPDDPDVPELVRRVADDRETYLKWGRDSLNWALYLFRKPFGA